MGIKTVCDRCGLEECNGSEFYVKVRERNGVPDYTKIVCSSMVKKKRDKHYHEVIFGHGERELFEAVPRRIR